MSTLLFYLSSLAAMKLIDMLLPLGIILITMSMLMQSRKRRRRGHVTHDFDRERIVKATEAKRGVRGEMDDMMVDIQQMAQKFAIQLDNKSAMLEKRLSEANQRIKEADQRIAELERLLATDNDQENT